MTRHTIDLPRDPKRIPDVLQELGRVWVQHPDWRLGQLIDNALHPPGHPERGHDDSWLFYVEDDDMLEALTKL